MICSCTSENSEYTTRAQIGLIGGLHGLLLKEQSAIIIYEDQQDSIQVRRVVLPEFEQPAFIGDSIEIIVDEDEIDFGNLLQYGYDINNRFTYGMWGKNWERKVFFDNGVLIIVDFEGNSEATAFDFYNYQTSETKDYVNVYFLGKNEGPAFRFMGRLGSDSLVVQNYEEEVYRVLERP